MNMKRHNAPQFELPIDGGFRLTQETAVDGQRVTEEAAARQSARESEESKQLVIGPTCSLEFSWKEWKVITLRECLAPGQMKLADEPGKAAEYYRSVIMKDDRYNPDIETLHVLALNTRRKVVGHYLVATGTADTLLVHPREVFRTAIVANAAAILLVHNHPSGDPTPSEADIKVTRDLIRAGQVIKIDVLDHIVIGHPNNTPPFTSLRELGYFYAG